jgi:hypothetical protein
MNRQESLLAVADGTPAALEHDTPPGIRTKVALSIWVFSSSIAWGAVRSAFLDQGSAELPVTGIPLWIRIAFFLLLALPAIGCLFHRQSFFWLLGLSGAVGVLPELPLVPFLRDYAHLVIVAGAVIVVGAISMGAGLTRSRFLEGTPGFVRVYLAYIAACAVSIFLNWILFENIWPLKVGISFLILFGCFAAVIVATTRPAWRARIDVVEIIDGFSWGALAQCAIAFVGVPLLFTIPYSQGNDTIFGLGFYDRYKSTFPGPVNLGMFSIVAVPLVVAWMRGSAAKSAWGWIYLQCAPWLVVISGSRTARLVVIAAIVALFVKAETRFKALMMLPSTIVAFYLGFYYNSFPAAVRAAFGDSYSASQSLKGHFFDLENRTGLVSSAIDALPFNASGHGILTTIMRERTLGSKLPVWLLEGINSVLGYGAGVGGYAQSGFPTAHTMLLNLLIDSGILGLVLFVVFIAWLSLRLTIRSFRASDRDSLTTWLCLIALASAMVANGTYVPQLWGFYLVTIILACAAAVGGDHSARSRAPADRGAFGLKSAS